MTADVPQLTDEQLNRLADLVADKIALRPLCMEPVGQVAGSLQMSVDGLYAGARELKLPIHCLGGMTYIDSSSIEKLKTYRNRMPPRRAYR
jgi:hypothetical protein